MQKSIDDIVLFLIVVSLLIIALVAFIIAILYLYRRKQIAFAQSLEQTRLKHERALMATQLEIQESTFRHVSREIHDNISLSLTLAKLQLNTLDMDDKTKGKETIEECIGILGESISELRDLSQGLNADNIIHHGLVKALEVEVKRIRQIGLFSIDNRLTGSPVYMDVQKELIIFRIIQEGFNNIIKHSEASHAELSLHYNSKRLYIAIGDDGNGFDTNASSDEFQAGLKNMETRVKMLSGTMSISTLPGYGTTLSFSIPFDEQRKTY